MQGTVRDVMADVKVRLTPDQTLRSAAVDLAAARTGLGIVDVVTREPDLEDVFLSLVRR